MHRFESAGLFGGSFDPPHLGHVALVEAAIALLRLNKLWIVPVETPAHRKLSGKADGRRRAAWLERLFDGIPEVDILDWELELAEPTPTLPTLLRLRSEFPKLIPVLLLGEDAFAGIRDWVGYPEHCRIADVAVFRRAGYRCQARRPDDAWHEVNIDAWHEGQGPGRVIRLEAELPDVSATRIRELVVQGRSVCGMVPESIRGEVETCYGSGDAREEKGND